METTTKLQTANTNTGARVLRGRSRAARFASHLVEALTHLALLFFAAVAFGAILWLVLASFKTGSELVEMPPTFLPRQWTLDNYVEILTVNNFTRNLLNSIIVAVPTIFLVLFTSSITGYVFAKYQFPAKEILFVLILSTMMIPFAVTLLPLFRFVTMLGWADTYQALVVPVCVSAFGIFLMRQFLEGIPNELIDAGRIDGASDWWIYLHIIIPLSVSPLSALAIFIFIANWDSYLWPIVITYSENMRTLPVALASLVGWSGRPRYNLTLTGAVLTVIPVLVFYAVAQRRFVRGVTLSGLKL